MAQQSPVPSMSPQDYVERLQVWTAAAADPGYLLPSSAEFVAAEGPNATLGLVVEDEPVTKPPLRQRFFEGVDRFLARYDTTFKED